MNAVPPEWAGRAWPSLSCVAVVLCRTAVLNDFEAVGYSIPALQPIDVVVINDVKPVPEVGG